MNTTEHDAALIEQIARAIYENRVAMIESETERKGWCAWEEHEKGDADEWRDLADAILPIVRKAERDAARGAALAMAEQFQYGGWFDALVNGDKLANANHVLAWLRKEISANYPEESR